MRWQILEGDTLSVLPALEAGSVQTCVTSPPYWGLRDYGTGTWAGGDPECDHLGAPFRTKANINANCGTGTDRKNAEGREPMGQTCSKCGATREDSQIGLEPTPEEYVAKMVRVFREVRRVLRDDGTLWLNLGDSYAGSTMGGGPASSSTLVGTHHTEREGARFNGKPRALDGLKPKDLVGIPWRVAFALQADGWYLRSDIIWHKPNPMPESVTDRPTKAHEYLFLLSKSHRYYYDADAIKEPATEGTDLGLLRGRAQGNDPGVACHAKSIRDRQAAGVDSRTAGSGQRNKRTVWTVATQPYAGAHFATFPPKLIEPCILAGSQAGDTVLDPFNGAGTTGMVALRHDRSFVGVELNPDYAQMARDRIRDDAPLLNVPAEV